jgi:hypothetical protein
MNLSELPRFTVEAVHDGSGEVRLSGRFSNLRGVRAGRSWLYVSTDGSLLGDLEAVDPTTGRAVFVTSGQALREPVRIGASFPWVEGYWQAYQVAMIVEPAHPWVNTVFVPGPARHFTLAGAHGWQAADAPLPDGAVDLGVRPGDWDHEHCEICEAKIGIGGAAAGFRDPDGHWLCEGCHASYAIPHDLSFLAGA